jgi:hypothetical protein
VKVNNETLVQAAIPVILILSTFFGQEIHLQMHWVLLQNWRIKTTAIYSFDTIVQIHPMRQRTQMT